MAVARHNLPSRLTSFVGREREIVEVAALVRNRRLVTLVGAPGVGKTRLGLQVASTLLGSFLDGIWLAELAPLATPELVPQAVADVLAVREQPGRAFAATLAEHLHARHLLLVLDNCEHLVGASAALIESLLQGCPGLHVLATSREALAVEGEVTWRVPSLTLPNSQQFGRAAGDGASLSEGSEAVRLFVARAQAAVHSFELTDRNASAVAQICARLDGIPLALELAAVRVRALSVQEIAARLEDRFLLLTAGSRSALPRQQTLRGTVEWSHELLTERERLLLRRLAVFAGGWTLEAAEAVCADEDLEPDGVLEALVSLVERSLVQVEEAVDGETRYRLLEMIRQYGLEKLTDAGEQPRVQCRHRDHFLDVAERSEPELNGPGQGAARLRLEREHDNLRAALAWSLRDKRDSDVGQPDGTSDERVSADTVLGTRLAGALWRFWWLCGFIAEGRRWLEQAIDASPADPRPVERTTRAKALFGAAQLASYQGDYPAAVGHMESALGLWHAVGHMAGVTSALQRLGYYFVNLGDYERASRLCDESVAIARTCGDTMLLASSLRVAGHVAWHSYQFERSAVLCDESLTLLRAIGSPGPVGYSLASLARAVLGLGDRTRATSLFEEALGYEIQAGDRRGIADAYKDLAYVALLDGDADRVIEMLTPSVRTFQDIGDRANTGACLREFARALILKVGGVGLAPVESGPARDCLLLAARIWAAGEVPREAAGIVGAPPLRDRYDRELAALRATLGEAAFARTRAEGRATSLDRAVELALAATAPVGPAPTEPTERQPAAVRAKAAMLTRRELEVAALVAEGLSNPQIAARLDLSDRTIDAHLRNIMGKLDVASRAQVAAWSVRHSQTPPSEV